MISVEKIKPHGAGCYGIITKRELHECCGGFDEELTFGEDTEYIERLAKKERFKVLRNAKIGVSTRRLEEEGLATLAKQYGKSTVNDFLGIRTEASDLNYGFDHGKEHISKHKLDKMRKHHLLGAILLCGGLFSCSSEVIQQANYEIIPLPQEIKISTGNFVLNDRTSIVYPKGNDEMQQNANLLATYIRQMSGKKLKVIDEQITSNVITLTTGLNTDNAEAYQLKVTPDNIIIRGASEAGTFYGIQTLRKSLPATNKGDISLPGVEINDYPRFSYRGVHLDVSRHFFPIDSIKRFIDMMALHNINRLHWHLTDDQGWRIEIKKRPELTTIGSKRSATVIGHNSGEYDDVPYSGFYSQDEAKDIVRYAQERHITVIPEIDLPGHMQAALAAYPELGCTGGPYEVWKMWGVSEDVLCAGND